MSEDKINMKKFKQRWNIRDKFYSKRHEEKILRFEKAEQLINLRFNLGEKLVQIKDKVAIKRYKEQLHLLEVKLGKKIKAIENALK